MKKGIFVLIFAFSFSNAFSQFVPFYVFPAAPVASSAIETSTTSPNVYIDGYLGIGGLALPVPIPYGVCTNTSGLNLNGDFTFMGSYLDDRYINYSTILTVRQLGTTYHNLLQFNSDATVTVPTSLTVTGLTTLANLNVTGSLSYTNLTVPGVSNLNSVSANTLATGTGSFGTYLLQVQVIFTTYMLAEHWM